MAIIGQRKAIEPAGDNDTALIAEMELAKMIGDVLMEHYPGYSWLVNVDSAGQIATIMCAQISGALSTNMPYRMVVHLKNLYDYGLAVKKVVRSAGELLERASLPRGKWNKEFPQRVDGVAERHQPNERLFTGSLPIRIL